MKPTKTQIKVLFQFLKEFDSKQLVFFFCKKTFWKFTPGFLILLKVFEITSFIVPFLLVFFKLKFEINVKVSILNTCLIKRKNENISMYFW